MMQCCQYQQLLLQNQLTENTRSLTTCILQSTPRRADAVLLCLLVKMGKSSLYFASAHYCSFPCVCFHFSFRRTSIKNPSSCEFFTIRINWWNHSQRKTNPSGMCKGSKEKEKGTEMQNTPLLTEISKNSQKFGDYSIMVTTAIIS